MVLFSSDGRVELTGKTKEIVETKMIILRKNGLLGIERGTIGLYYAQNSLWKRYGSVLRDTKELMNNFRKHDIKIIIEQVTGFKYQNLKVI
jgi:hypothetical protein